MESGLSRSRGATLRQSVRCSAGEHAFKGFGYRILGVLTRSTSSHAGKSFTRYRTGIGDPSAPALHGLSLPRRRPSRERDPAPG